MTDEEPLVYISTRYEYDEAKKEPVETLSELAYRMYETILKNRDRMLSLSLDKDGNVYVFGMQFISPSYPRAHC